MDNIPVIYEKDGIVENQKFDKDNNRKTLDRYSDREMVEKAGLTAVKLFKILKARIKGYKANTARSTQPNSPRRKTVV